MGQYVIPKEYEICVRRGHEAGQSTTTASYNAIPKIECKWCGITYYYQPQQLVEVDPPKPLKKGSE